jgi:hypothetical protein
MERIMRNRTVRAVAASAARKPALAPLVEKLTSRE